MKQLCLTTIWLAFVITSYAQQKIAHLNSTEIMSALPEVNLAKTSIETFQANKIADIDKMGAEFQRRLKTAQEKQKTISEANKETVAKELQAMELDLQSLEKRIEEAKQKAREEIERKTAELFNPIQLKVSNAIKAVAIEKGFSYVMDTVNPALLFWENGEDIGLLVKNKLGVISTKK